MVLRYVFSMFEEMADLGLIISRIVSGEINNIINRRRAAVIELSVSGWAAQNPISQTLK